MGLSCGFIAASLPLPALVARLEMQVGKLADLGVVDNPDEAYAQPPTDVNVMLSFEQAGHAYFIDFNGWLSANPDLIVHLSAEQDALVVGDGAATVGGTYWFVAARGGQLLRHYFYRDHPQPYDWGEWLPTEAACPLNNFACHAAALGSLGFDPDYYVKGTGPAKAWAYQGEPPPRPLTQAVQGYFDRVLRATPSRRGTWLGRFLRRFGS